MLVADVETFGTDPKNGKLLGVAFCPVDLPDEPSYMALQWYDHLTSTWHVHPDFKGRIEFLQKRLMQYELIGHNYAFDKSWLDYHLGIETKWHADTRLMWHMASAPSGPRPYGLKDAQVEVLGWEKRGDVELEEQVKARGGSLNAGNHYLADVDILSKYACKDASSTALLYNALKPFFDEHDYWWMLEKMISYSWLLEQNTQAGILVDVDTLKEEIDKLTYTKEAYTAQFMELAAPHINKLERIWKEDRASKYTMNAARERFLASWDMQKKFKLSSDKDKRELFYEIFKLPVLDETDGGKPSTATETIKVAAKGREDIKESIEALEAAETSETILNSFAKPWLDEVKNERLHPRFNPCGTVSYRLSGFKPYLLNAPFEEKDLMSCLQCDSGFVGVHADFVSVEPAVTAHYSQDPSLLKVFRDGLGDVYLDLAATLFPEDKEIKAIYDPLSPPDSKVKEALKTKRSIAKILHLAMQYGGTEYTISKNLMYAGFNVPRPEARELVKAYWQHFKRVKVMNEALFIKFEKQGYLRNSVGRVIRVPTTLPVRRRDGTIWEKPIRYKDLPNRFIQSSAHDLLSFWVLGIAGLVNERGLSAKPLLVDCHDSTSWQCPVEEKEKLIQVFKDALTQLNDEVKLTVPIKAEIKTFQTLAGLKGDE